MAATYKIKHEDKRASNFLDAKVSYSGEMAKMNINTRRKAMNLYIANGFHFYEATKEGNVVRIFMCVNPIDPTIFGQITKTEYEYVLRERERLGLQAPSMLRAKAV